MQKTTYLSNIESFSNTSIKGWVLDKDDTGKHQRVRVFADGKLVGSTTANKPHPTLKAQNIGDGCFAFEVKADFSKTKKIEVKVGNAPGVNIKGSPIDVKKSNLHLFGHFDGFTHGYIYGWCIDYLHPDTPQQVEIYDNNKLLTTLKADHFRQDIRDFSNDIDGHKGIFYKIPPSFMDGKKHKVSIKLAGKGKTYELDNSPITFDPHFNGYLDETNSDVISGWALALTIPEQSIKLDIYINDSLADTITANHDRQDIRSKFNVNGSYGFNYRLKPEHLKQAVKIDVKYADTNISLAGSPMVLHPYDDVLNSLNQVASAINDISANTQIQAKQQSIEFVKQALTKSFGDIQQRAKNNSGWFIHQKLDNANKTSKLNKKIVDVILPIYDGLEETVACIEHYYKAKNKTKAELIAIIDGSPNPGLITAVKALHEKYKFTLLENEQNKGFVYTVNRGMQLHPDRDVVLLNSDTEVYNNWLDKMYAAAQANPQVGTITPLSNNAEICSYPLSGAVKEKLDDISWAELDKLCAQVNSKKTIEIPTGVGFCMYVTREALNSAGYFNEELWHKGYAEENDFCMKAYYNGYKNLLLTDTFVYHAGGVSFGADKLEMVNKNLGKLNEVHPGYDFVIQRYVKANRDKYLWANLDIARVKRQFDKSILLVMPNIAGGTKKYTLDLFKRLADNKQSCFLLSYDNDGNIKLKHNILTDLSQVYYKQSNIAELIKQLKKADIWHIHYQHTLNIPDKLLELSKHLNCKYDVTLHDYYTICPRVNLVDDTNSYCGEPKAQVCNNCIKLNGPAEIFDGNFFDKYNSVKEFKSNKHSFLKAARKLYAPSNDAAKRIAKHYKLNIQVMPHEFTAKVNNIANSKPGKTIRIGIIGAVNESKGAHILCNMAKHAYKNNLPLEFVIIGYTNMDDKFAKYSNVTITGKYTNNELSNIIKSQKLDLFFLPSIWPEIYCYTLSEGYTHGLYPVAFDIGAPAERIKQAKYGQLIKLGTPAADINEQLITAAKSKSRENKPKFAKVFYKDIVKDYYGL